ncbi:hypothetical protein FACS189413_06740 [Bacteroidia bacterium]|nr:hypothetical protein FACS189413_06740 [Bacteroidia bacterium]
MKNSLLTITLFAFLFPLWGLSGLQAQNKDADNIALSIWIPDNIDGLTAAAKQNLQNKLLQIATNNGISSVGDSRFVLTANVIVTNKHISPDIPAKFVYEMDVTLYIGDGFDGKTFSSVSTTIKGIGTNETKAFNNALKNIRVNNPDYKTLVANGKNSIINYFNSRCDVFVKEIQTLAETQQYRRAMGLIASIPTECTACWSKVLEAEKDLFYKRIDTECKTLILTATNIWNAGQDYDSAVESGFILSQINPQSACDADAVALSDKISLRMKELNQREWDFLNRAYDKETETQQTLIRALRDIGVAFGENQQPVDVIYKTLW